MARASSNPEKARSGGGVEAGNYEVMNSKYQNIKTERKDNQTHLVLHCAVLDKDGDKVRDAENVDIQFGFGPKALEFLHPGKGKDRSDVDPEDLGDGVDVEGNTVWCEEGAQFNRSCGYMVFNDSLVKVGFPKSTLDESFADNYVGLKFELATLPAAEINQLIGTRLNTKPFKGSDGSEVNMTYKIARKWLNPNYLTGGGAKGGATATSAPAAAPAEKLGDEEIAKLLVQRVAAAKKGPKNTIKSQSQFVGFATNEMAKAKLGDAKALAAAQKFMKDVTWLNAALLEVGANVDAEYGESGEVTKINSIEFPE